MTRPLFLPYSNLSFMKSILIVMIPLTLYITHLSKTILLEFEIFSPSPTYPSLTLIIDPMSTIFMTTVTLISTCVYIFTKNYMKEEVHLSRFSSLVMTFIVSMMILICIPNMITLMLGWDGLGLTSFLLIIYYQNPKSLGAGMLTFMSNRVGDILIIISIVLTLSLGQWNMIHLWNDPLTPYLSLTLMLGAITKSAQIPFSSWLPAAMAAPTPVSALVHSSTLVTAGIYILIRFFPTLSTNDMVMKMLMLLATLTTLMAGLAALFETDMKKIIALSTLSQLGMMMMSLSLYSPTFAFFHLISHAMFKALLFISAGTLIHTFMNTQDLRILGNVSPSMPLTTTTMNIANIALCGLPFLSGFYSKDMIIEMSFNETSNIMILMLTLMSTALTAAYSFRFSFYTMWSSNSFSTMVMKTDNLQNNYTNPMIILSFAAITTGSMMNWVMIFPYTQNPLPMSLKLSAIMVTLIGIIMSKPKNLMFLMKPNKKLINIPNTLMTMWFLTPLSTQMMVRPFMSLTTYTTQYLDHGWNELTGPQGIHMILSNSSQKVNSTSNLSISTMILTSIILMPLLIVSLI